MNPDLLDDRAAANRVPCTEPRCNAQAGDPCVNVHTGLPLEHQPAHLVRVKAGLAAAGIVHAPIDSRDLRRSD